MLNALDLFSGIGGNSLALREWVNTVAYCEADRHAQAVLLSRMSDGQLKPAPICKDVQQLDGNELRGHIDLIIAGFPCQDISSLGKGAGLEGKRSGLFFEVLRLAKEIQPTFLFLENVPRIRTRGLSTVVRELTAAGYDCRWTMLSAASVGAPHKRGRWFCGAFNTHCANAAAKRSIPSRSTIEPSGTCKWWETEPSVDRVADGVHNRLDRIKRLGNAVVPQQAREAFKMLMGI